MRPPRPLTAWQWIHCSFSKIRAPRAESPGITGRTAAEAGRRQKRASRERGALPRWADRLSNGFALSLGMSRIESGGPAEFLAGDCTDSFSASGGPALLGCFGDSLAAVLGQAIGFRSSGSLLRADRGP